MFKDLEKLLLSGIFAAILCVGIPGCAADVDEGPVEEAAESVDEAVEETADEIDDATVGDVD